MLRSLAFAFTSVLGFFAPAFQRQIFLFVFGSQLVSHAVCVMLFFCGFEQYHIFCRSCYEEAVAFSEAHKKLSVFQALCRFVKAFDFDALAVSVNDAFWIHKDGD